MIDMFWSNFLERSVHPGPPDNRLKYLFFIFVKIWIDGRNQRIKVGVVSQGSTACTMSAAGRTLIVPASNHIGRAILQFKHSTVCLTGSQHLHLQQLWLKTSVLRGNHLTSRDSTGMRNAGTLW